MNCTICGYPLPEPGKAYGTYTTMCQGHPIVYAPNPPSNIDQGCKPLRMLTEQDVRRIVREELSRSDNE